MKGYGFCINAYHFYVFKWKRHYLSWRKSDSNNKSKIFIIESELRSKIPLELLSPDKLDNHYICNMKYDENLLYVQTPSLSIEEVTQEYILLNINGEFKKFIEDMDNSCIRYTYENASKWFNKEWVSM